MIATTKSMSADWLEEHGIADYDEEAFYAYVAYLGGDNPEDAAESFEDAYQGSHGSMREFAEQLADDLGAVPDDAQWPLNHIDWDSAARELSMDYGEQDGYIFRAV